MAWNRGTMSAKEILGMEPDELKNKLDSAVTKDDLAAATGKIEEQGNMLSAIQASLAKLTAPPAPEPDPNFEADLNDPTTQMITDPAGFVGRATAGINNTALSAKADVLEMRARSAYPGAFSQYNEELMSGANRFSVQQRAQENFWDFHIRTFMGDKYISGKTQGSYPSTLGTGGGPGAVGDPDSDPNRGFDPQVASFLKDRGVPLEKAAKIKQLLDSGEPISIESVYGRVAHA